MIKGIIFDLDGTLVNTLEYIANNMNIVLEEKGFKTYSLEDYRSFIGNGLVKLVRRTIPNEFGEETVDACLNRFRELHDENYDNSIKLYEGIDSILLDLESMGIKKAILSNKLHYATVETYNRYLKKYNFEEVWGWEKGVYKLKPDPTKALEIANNMGIKPENIVFVGDSDVDIKTAKNAGFMSIGVSWGFRDVNELIDEEADLIANNPKEIIEFIKNKNN